MNFKFGNYLTIGIVILLLGGVMVVQPDQAIKKVPTTHKVIALTFDDGPSNITTPALLSVLAAKKARATFFVLGSQVEKYPALAKDIAGQGHELASHSYNHCYLNQLKSTEMIQELQAADKAIAAAGQKPTLIRPPGGGYNDRMVAELKQYGYTTILWSIDPRDWNGRSAQQIANTVISRAEPGAIVVLHEGKCAGSTAAAVEIIINRLSEQGYRFITVSELLQYYEIRK